MDALRIQANELFRNGKYSQAIEKYTEAIELDANSKSMATFYANRSFASLKLELYGDALNDSNKSIELDESYAKAYYRRAAALMALQKYKLACEDLKKVAILQEKAGNPDKFIHQKIKSCEKLIRTAAFERAIAVEGRKEPIIAHTIDIEQYKIPDDYQGPRLVNDKKVDLKFVGQLIDFFKESKLLPSRYVIEILRQAYNLFEAQPSLIDIRKEGDKPFTIVGDIHGQYFDLCNIFKFHKLPSETNPYLFNGDVVDRGAYSVECILLLLSLKLLYPNHMFISRGNHETQSMNQMYGFGRECSMKYSTKIYGFFSQVFQVLPLAHCITGYHDDGRVGGKALAMHGGLFSTDDVKLDDIRNIDRNRQPPEQGLMCEILWSDPVKTPGRSPSKRGIAVGFGPDVTESFCKLNGLSYIVRSHEVKMSGYEIAHDGKCNTVFSAPNYCNTMGNLGAILIMKDPELSYTFKTFQQASDAPKREGNQFQEYMNFI